MATFAAWTLVLLVALPCSWTWTPLRTQYSLADSYLNAAQRPLWILEDEPRRRMRQDRGMQTAPLRIVVRPDAEPPQAAAAPPPPPLRIVVRPDAAPPPSLGPPSPHPLRIPTHLQRRVVPHHPRPSTHHFEPLRRRQPRTELRRRQPQSLPIFDNAPGDNALTSSSYPIFVYNGTKGELLLNTMLSAQRYPMQEPVPGQILYPPSTPMFRPKPIVERFRLPVPRELLNLTLIPFYAHEAITTAPITTMVSLQKGETSDTTPTASPVLATSLVPTIDPTENPTFAPTFAPTFPPTTSLTSVTAVTRVTAATLANSAPVPPHRTTPLPRPYETQVPRSKRRRNPKKAKQYNAYHSPQEVVQRQPVLRGSPALTAPNNHRQHLDSPAEDLLEEEEDQQEEIEQLTSEIDHEGEELDLELDLEHQQLEEPTNAEGNSLQIVYMDESVESPTDTLASTTVVPTVHRQSSRYSMKREYFAFPVYTLGKLLQDPNPASDKVKMGHIVELGDSSEQGETWFILNSRYKGPHRRNQSKYFTSKYVQNPKGSRR